MSKKILLKFIVLISQGGVRGLWRGNGMNILKIAPESAVKFAAYDFFKRRIRGDADRDLLMSERFANLFLFYFGIDST